MSRPSQLCLRWPRERIEVLRAAAARRGLSMSAMLSMLLADEVRREGGGQGPGGQVSQVGTGETERGTVGQV
jgi:hypothetical protein